MHGPSPRPDRSRHGARRAALGLFVAAVLTGCGLFGDGWPPPALPTPDEVDIAYGPVEGCEGLDTDCGGSQQLDIHRSEVPGPNPVLVWIHGGGFVSGDKAGVSGYLQPILDDGWDIVAVNYRLTAPDGTNRFPAGFQDVNRAVRWIRANAAARDWDATSVAAIGHSAGGNLAALLAAAPTDPALQPTDLPPELAGVDPSVVAAIATNPVLDLGLFAAHPTWSDAVSDYTGCTARDCSAAHAAGSVWPHVSAGSAPVLSIHGVDDPLASPAHADLVAEAYRAAGIPSRFETIVVDDGPERYQGHTPDDDRFAERYVEFLDEHRAGTPS